MDVCALGLKVAFLYSEADRAINSPPTQLITYYITATYSIQLFFKLFLDKNVGTGYKRVVKARKALQKAHFGYAVKIPFQSRAELQRFTSFCKERAHFQGAFVRLAVIEKMDRTEGRA